MAPINLPVSVTFTLEDETGSSGYMTVNVGAAATLADIRTAASALIPLIEAATLGAVVSYSIAATTVETAPRTPLADSRVERRAFTSWRTAAGKKANITVPTLDPALVLSSGRIDEDAAAFALLYGALIAAPWTDSNGSDLVSMDEAYEVFRTTKKTQKPSDRKTDANTVSESA